MNTVSYIIRKRAGRDNLVGAKLYKWLESAPHSTRSTGPRLRLLRNQLSRGALFQAHDLVHVYVADGSIYITDMTPVLNNSNHIIEAYPSMRKPMWDRIVKHTPTKLYIQDSVSKSKPLTILWPRTSKQYQKQTPREIWVRVMSAHTAIL